MTVHAPYAVTHMSGRSELRLLMRIAVTLQTARARLVGRQFPEPLDPRHVAATLHMLSAWSMAGFATMFLLVEKRRVRRLFETALVQILMAGLAHIRPDEFGFIASRWCAPVFREQ
jgi:hypothetical protein